MTNRPEELWWRW